MNLAERALQKAASQMGVHEQPKGSNWGPQVQAFLASVGIKYPAPWCMAFVYWCFNEAAKDLSAENPLIKTGLVLNAWNKAKLSNGKMHPNAGDIFIMDAGAGKGHTGLVEKVEGIWIYTIEGNTNDEGVREGFEVCRRRRPLSKMKGYLRY